MLRRMEGVGDCEGGWKVEVDGDGESDLSDESDGSDRSEWGRDWLGILLWPGQGAEGATGKIADDKAGCVCRKF